MTWRFGLDLIVLQGTKVLEDHEIRHTLCVTAQGSPPQRASPKIIKYTGNLTFPEWVDAEPGRVFSFPWHLVKYAQSPKDKFETLCHVTADISSVPYTTHYTKDGGMGYKRYYEVILLVGLTELKAQISWVNERTVRGHIISHLCICPI